MGAIINNIKRRQAKRRAEKAESVSLGGSKEAQRQLLGAAAEDRRQSTQARVAGRKELEGELEHARSDDAQRGREYQGARLANARDLDSQRAGVAGINQAAQGGIGMLGNAGTQASNILGSAYGSNQLTGSTENVLAQRAAALGAAPSAQSLAEQAISAQNANMQANTNFAQGQLARQAMGVAAGQGEGGALAAQQAIASLVNAGGNMSAQNQLAQAEAAANMRAAAAQQARNETLSSADIGAQARLQAAAAERANQLATAQQQAGIQTQTAAQQAGLLTQGAQATQNALQGVSAASQAAQNTQAGMAQQAQAQRSGIAEALGSQANQAEGTVRNYEASILNAGADAATNALNAKGRTLAQKVFTPFGMLGN